MNRMYKGMFDFNLYKGEIMNYFKHRKKCNTCGPCGPKIRFTEILGIMIAIIGAIIIVQILPLKMWLFLLGILFVILGSTLIRLF